ncbi:MmgE/PrpD family protein [Hoeflea poritis]|uniref:MmgE/PrpD family protein n=1 Tax=Hoeflea poritis TaxID=2993659 RepID=A0ABT4VUY2_9HYPH|nr:MmgE/PrpD family protein [Hoeflea poritis]MDA4848525.1 MmgE/PrpD family protein [Hoeflea poritis]
MSDPSKFKPFWEIAGLCSSLTIKSCPADVRDQAKLCILDTVGCIAAGSRDDDARRLLAAELGVAGNKPSRASVIGSSRKVPTDVAAIVNAYMGDVFELNDLIAGHASIAVVPTALALGQEQESAGTDVLSAIIAGIEATARIYNAYYPTMKSYEDVGVTPPGIPSTIGVAAACAKLLGGDRAQVAEAMAISGALAGWCPAEVIFGEGRSTKPLLFGSWPGSVGLRAARYAMGGLTGPPALLESPIGLFATLARRFDSAALTAQTWALTAPRRKFHACCGYIHSAIDASIELRKSGIDPNLIIKARVFLPPYIIAGVKKDEPPSTPMEARFHAEYCIALALGEHDVILPEHTVSARDIASDPRFERLMNSIEIREDLKLDHYHQCRVEIELVDGTTRKTACNAPKGSPSNPLSDDEVITKFLTLASDIAEESDLRFLIGRVSELERITGGLDFIFEPFEPSFINNERIPHLAT